MPTDPRDLRGDAPLLDAWLRFYESDITPFTVPGHKQRLDIVGDVVAGDTPFYGGVGTVKGAKSLLAEGEARAAQLWGADYCRFSVGGSTQVNQGIALAVGREGDRVVVSRTLHRSVLSGIVLAGLVPVWVTPDIDPGSGLPRGVAPAAVSAALSEHPDAVAVFVGDPSYAGGVGDVAGLAAAAHAHEVPLIVDAAWAAHFGFHPALPEHALALGADAIVTSAHKTLPSWSQAALLLARTGLLDPARLEAGIEATATTSPSGPLLASIDAARALLARDGEELLGQALAATGAARAAFAQVEGLKLFDGPGTDPLKLTLVLPWTGADGVAIEDDLLELGIPLETADRDVIVAVVTLADTAASVGRLTEALVEAIERRRGAPRAVVPSAAFAHDPVVAMAPRQAYFADHETVPAERAIGRVSAELIAPYPPGVPTLAPGEEITTAAVATLHAAREAGVRIAYAADPTLATYRVVR